VPASTATSPHSSSAPTVRRPGVDRHERPSSARTPLGRHPPPGAGPRRRRGVPRAAAVLPDVIVADAGPVLAQLLGLHAKLRSRCRDGGARCRPQIPLAAAITPASMARLVADSVRGVPTRRAAPSAAGCTRSPVPASSRSSRHPRSRTGRDMPDEVLVDEAVAIEHQVQEVLQLRELGARASAATCPHGSYGTSAVLRAARQPRQAQLAPRRSPRPRARRRRVAERAVEGAPGGEVRRGCDLPSARGVPKWMIRRSPYIAGTT